MKEKRQLIDSEDIDLSISQQCALLGLSKSSFYYTPAGESDANLSLMLAIDKLYTVYPFYGARRMVAHLKDDFGAVNIKRVRRLMGIMGISALYPQPHMTKANKGLENYSYLLENKLITNINQVWSTDITYLPMRRGFLYLVAIMDWYSRFILSWRLSNTLLVDFCVDCLEDSLLRWGGTEIFNSDQGSQFTSLRFRQVLQREGIKISVDGRGRALDNVFIERFWRSLKYECIYLNAFENGEVLSKSLEKYIHFYNFERKHQALNYLTPAQVHLASKKVHS